LVNGRKTDEQQCATGKSHNDRRPNIDSSGSIFYHYANSNDADEATGAAGALVRQPTTQISGSIRPAVPDPAIDSVEESGAAAAGTSGSTETARIAAPGFNDRPIAMPSDSDQSVVDHEPDSGSKVRNG